MGDVRVGNQRTRQIHMARGALCVVCARGGGAGGGRGGSAAVWERCALLRARSRHEVGQAPAALGAPTALYAHHL